MDTYPNASNSTLSVSFPLDNFILHVKLHGSVLVKDQVHSFWDEQVLYDGHLRGAGW